MKDRPSGIITEDDLDRVNVKLMKSNSGTLTLLCLNCQTVYTVDQRHTTAKNWYACPRSEPHTWTNKN